MAIDRAGRSLEAIRDEFRASHPIAEVRIGSDLWRYFRGRDGARPVLWLTGALGSGELGFAQIVMLGKEFRVLAPDYPPVPTLDRMVDGQVAILDAEGVRSAHVVAGSFGGMIAQHLVRRHPERVRSLVLSHTYAPGFSGISRRVPRLLGLFPKRVLQALVRRRLSGSFAVGGPFWMRFFESAVEGLSKAEILSRVRLALEFSGQGTYGPRDLEHWPGEILILEADDDPLVSAPARSALRALYPAARVRSFSGTGHSAALIFPGLYAESIRDFLRTFDQER